MKDLNLANELIPGYKTLPNNIRAEFEATDTGAEFIQIIQQVQHTENKGLFAWLFKTTLRESTIESAQDYLHYSSNQYGKLAAQIQQIRLKSIVHTEFLRQVEKSYLNRLNKTWNNHAHILNIEHFNTDHAKMLTNTKMSVDEWLNNYEASLLEYIKINIGLINGKEAFPRPPLLSKKRARESLTYLYNYLSSVRNNQKEVTDCIDSIYRLADAHAFLQATGFATQNETSLLALFDIVNYFRIAGHVAAAKTILTKFIQPFTPLFIEYYTLNKEQNNFRQIFRTVMPMLIVSVAVIVVSALLSSFVIPEIAFLFILIPTLYLGLIAATSYVIAKDRIYNNLRQLWFGGQFEIPEFQVSDGMIAIFGSEERARIIRDFYVDEISTCFKKEKQFQTQTRLNQLDTNDRQDNANRNRVLHMEWYDIHSNPNLSTDEALNSALNRLYLDGRKALTTMRSELDKAFKKEIPDFIHEISSEIKIDIERNVRPALSALKQSRFFTRPSCFKHRDDVERLNQLQNALGNG